MGGASSRFAETDWNAVDGGLRDTKDTVDGRQPTTHHTILTLKKSNVVNQREFEIRDDLDELLYTSKPIEGTSKWFDLFDALGKKLFCIQTDSLRSQWQVHSYAPNWEGQMADPDVKSEAPLYRKARIGITWNKYHGEVHPFVQSDSDAMGVATETPLLRCEEIAGITAQCQSYVPKDVLLDNALHPPLVGWWVREHTLNRHQMKMHLAKGADIALHCIVAITTNMVNIEKKAEEI
jgi:hypothetical protein